MVVVAVVGCIAVSAAATTALVRQAAHRLTLTVRHAATGRALLPPVTLAHLWPHRRWLLAARHRTGPRQTRITIGWRRHG